MRIENKYVAFCDILGFSDLVKSDFDKAIFINEEFKKELNKFPSLGLLSTSIYSDSILIVGDNVIDVAKTVQILLWVALRNDCLVRGGIAYGRHSQESNKNNLYIVSEALVKAVEIEKKISNPIIAISDEIVIGMDYWVQGFVHTVFDLPIISYNQFLIVTPFNNFWFKSAHIKLEDLRLKHPKHRVKYDFLLTLIKDISSNREFIPKSIIDELLAKGLIEKTVANFR